VCDLLDRQTGLIALVLVVAVAAAAAQQLYWVPPL